MQEFSTLDGAILIDKPAGPTSHDVVDAIRRRFGIKKVGHCGTLDPNAVWPPTGIKVTIWREGDQLFGQAWGKDVLQGAFEIYPESETNFFLKVNGAQLTFIKNDKGEVTSVVHHYPGVPDSVGKKIK
jgi:hypothetical protein